jgi:protein involved in polysaccharide export with SLBB domain
MIIVPRGVEFVTMGGAFRGPRRFDLAPGDSLSTLLRLAGGLLPSASRERALFLRFVSPTEQESTWLDVARSKPAGRIRSCAMAMPSSRSSSRATTR